MSPQEGPLLTPGGNRRRGLAHAAAVVSGYALLHTALVAPILWEGRPLLDAGDAAGYHYPAVYGSSALWEPNLLGGFPRLADPQMMSWYPPAVLLRLTGAEWLWNPFALMPAVLASAFVYGLALRLTGSRLGAALAGLVYGAGSFLALHVVHTALVHAAAWLPLVLWSLEELRHRFSRAWVVTLALAIALLILAGHPQVGAYGLGLSALYAVVYLPGAPVGWRRFGTAAVLGFALGLGLTAVQILPTAEFIRHSGRQSVDFATFTSYALPRRQLPMLLFPFAYGWGQGFFPHGLDGAMQRTPYFGSWNIVGVSGFCGLLPLVLGVVGFLTGRRTRGAWLWAAVTVGALVFALGADTPAGELFFRVPLLNKFRCPARAFLLYQLAVAVLAAHGACALRALPRLTATRLLAFGTSAVVLALVAAWWVIRSQGVSPWPWINPEIGRPLVLFVLGTAALGSWLFRPGRVAAALVVLALAADVAQLGCYTLVGHMGTVPSGSALRRAPAALEAIRADLRRSGERLLAADSRVILDPGADAPDSAHANLTALWGLPNAEGYSPFDVQRQRDLVTLAGRERVGVEILGIRYLVRCDRTRVSRLGLEWTDRGFCPPPVLSVAAPLRRFGMPPTPGTRLALITALGNAVTLPDGAPVAEVVVHTTEGDVPLTLRAGEHVGECACDRPDVRPAVRHGRPALSWDVPGGGVPEHHFLASLSFGYRRQVTGLDLRWTGPAGPALAVCLATLVDDATGECHPVQDVMGDPDLWEVSPPPPGSGLLVARSKLPLHRAWLVGRVFAMPAEQARAVVIGGAPLPDGTPFRPYETALIEGPVSIEPSAGGEAAITTYDPCRVTVAVRSSGGGLLVLGDVNYPGWRATVDGVPAKVFQTDYVLRGVAVPPGEHVVEFRFRPTTFYLGAAISALSAALLLGAMLTSPTRQRGSVLAGASGWLANDISTITSP